MCAEPFLYKAAYSHVCACGKPIGYGSERCWRCQQNEDALGAFDFVIDELNDEIARKVKEKENESK